jgi:hypothetical protein
MANDPFSREIINVRERPLSSDTNIAESYLDRSLRDFIRALLAPDPLAVVTGFLNQSFKVVATTTPSMTVNISPGLGFIDDASDVPTAIGGVLGVNDVSTMKPLPLSAVQPIVIDGAPSAGNSRYDIIEVKCDRRSQDPTSRDILDPATGVFAPNLVNKTLAFYLDGRNARVVSPAPSTTGIGYKVGVAATSGTEVVPATTAGYVKIAEIHVVSGVTTITNSVITDTRPGSGLALLAGTNVFTGPNHFSTAVTNGDGAIGTGNGTGSGLEGYGGNGVTAGPGVLAWGGVGSSVPAPGLEAIGGATNGPGIKATGQGNGEGIHAVGGANAQGGYFAAGASHVTGAINLNPQAAPTSPENGDIWYDVADNTLKVLLGGVVRTIADTSRAAPQRSSGSGTFSTASATPVDVTGTSVTIVSTGKPMVVALEAESSAFSHLAVTSVLGDGTLDLLLIRDSTTILQTLLSVNTAGGDAITMQIPPGSVHVLDAPAAGSHTYKLQAYVSGTAAGGEVTYCKLLVYEI